MFMNSKHLVIVRETLCSDLILYKLTVTSDPNHSLSRIFIKVLLLHKPNHRQDYRCTSWSLVSHSWALEDWHVPNHLLVNLLTLINAVFECNLVSDNIPFKMRLLLQYCYCNTVYKPNF